MAGHAKQHRAILDARRTGKSEWHGCSPQRVVGRERVPEVADVGADRRGEAIAAGQKLMAEKGHRLAPDVRLGAAIDG